jgi:hypothetical protein
MESIQKHLTAHSSFEKHQIEAMIDAARDPASKLSARDCPFCDEWADKLDTKSPSFLPKTTSAPVSFSEFKEHVAMHQEHLAVDALLWYDGPDDNIHERLGLESLQHSDLGNGLFRYELSPHLGRKQVPAINQFWELENINPYSKLQQLVSAFSTTNPL